MRKQEFLHALKKKLSGLPQSDIEERLTFYSEMIDDRMEEGLSEEEAISEVGSVKEIAAQIMADIPLGKIAKKRIKPKRQLSTWEIVLLVLGSPIWLSLVIAAIAVVISLYAALWSVIISLWAVFVSLVASSFGSILAGIALICAGKTFTGIATIGAGIFCAGLSIFLFYGCKATTKGILILTKTIAIWIKNRLTRKEKTQ